MKFIQADNAIIEQNVSIGDDTKVWYGAHIREGAKIGSNCVIGDNAYVGEKVIIGDEVSIGNQVCVCEGVVIKDKVRILWGTKFTNVRFLHPTKKGRRLNTIVEDGVCIGANCVIAADIVIGHGAVIGDGTIVLGDVAPDTFVVGNPGHRPKKK